jgi:hypothetical protein
LPVRRQLVGGGIDAPGAVGEVGRAAVDEVLAVVHIKDREAAVRFVKIGFREIHNHITLCGEEV